MISVAIAFAIGLIVGGLAAVGAGLAILYQPLPKREPITYHAIAAGAPRSTGPETPFETLNRILR
jgi:hypothetical protein